MEEEREEDGKTTDDDDVLGNEEEAPVSPADEVVDEWAEGKTIVEMLQTLPQMLPTGVGWMRNFNIHTADDVRWYYRRALLRVHPDRIPVTSTAVEHDIVTKTTARFTVAFIGYKQSQS